MVNDNLNWLKPKAANILIHLLNEKEINLTDLQRKVGGSYTSIYSAINALIDAALITEEKRASAKLDSKRAVVIGVSRVFSLTSKGKKIAKKLLEINKIMEEEK